MCDNAPAIACQNYYALIFDLLQIPLTVLVIIGFVVLFYKSFR